MKSFTFESIINVIVFAFLTVYVIIIVNQSVMNNTNSRNFNDFYGENSMKLEISTVDENFSFDPRMLGDNFVIYDTILDINGSFTENRVRAVYGKGNFPIPILTEGVYFTEEQMLSEEPFCVIGTVAAERMCVEIDGKMYFPYENIFYEVIGYMGLEGPSDLDIIVMINWGAYYGKERFVNTKYLFDAFYEDDINAAYKSLYSIAQDFENSGMEISYNNIYYENNIRSFDYYSRYVYFWGAVLLILTLIIVSLRYIEKQQYVISVKKLIGCSTFRLFAETSAKFICNALVGFVFGVAGLKIASVSPSFVKSELAYFTSFSPKTMIYSVAAIFVLSFLFSLIPVRKALKIDTSELIK